MDNKQQIEHETWKILDSSKMKCYMTCPRKYFYKYVLGWSPEGANIHLIFGEGWHRAMEILFREGYTKESVAKGHKELKAYYDSHFSKNKYNVYYPKEPNRALEALAEYVNKYQGKDDWEVEYTEVAGTVSITANQVLHFRMDAVVKNDYDERILIDHKTTGRGGSRWRDKWGNSFQIKLYMHALYSLFGNDKVDKALINGAIIRKKSLDFERVPVRLTPNVMEEWLDNAQYWARMINAETEGFRKELHNDGLEDQDVMNWFRQNPTSCMKYGKCPYFDFCTSWSNPMKRTMGKPPIGFEIDRWDPSELRSNVEVEL